jgi:DNA-binding SARP family transcriptional activator/pimeloyl-ACP methyl ester carboxylesterase
VLVVRVLGAVDVELDGRRVPVTSTKQRLLVAILAASRGVVSRDRLVAALWEEPPPSAPSTLMGYVSRLRRAVGRDAIAASADGYLLIADQVDAREFERLAQRGGADALEEGLRLWRGDAFGELAANRFLVGEARRLRELRTSARLELAEAHLATGDTARPVSMLEALVGEEPIREDAWVLLVRALAAGGRYADAVRAAHRCRRELVEVGLEPSAALVEAEAAAIERRAAAGRVEVTDLDVGPLRYALHGDVHIAHQVAGGGPVDLVLSSYGSVSIDSIWDEPRFSRFVSLLGASCRVVLYDTRGIGLSDPIDVDAPPTIHEQSEDLQAVIEQAGANRPVVVGIGDGGPTAITYAHRHPKQLAGLILINTFARLVEAPGYRGVAQDDLDANLRLSTDATGARDTSLVLRNHAPSVSGDAEFRRWWERAGRRGASPATATALWRVRYGADVRGLLHEIATPTLVLHRRRARVIPRSYGEYLAEQIAGARYVELDGSDQPPFTETAEAVAALIADFATSCRARDA